LKTLILQHFIQFVTSVTKFHVVFPPDTAWEVGKCISCQLFV